MTLEVQPLLHKPLSAALPPTWPDSYTLHRAAASAAVVTHWLPLVFGPALAIETTPGACKTPKPSSANFLP